jgi:signal transduction histidine kinase
MQGDKMYPHVDNYSELEHYFQSFIEITHLLSQSLDKDVIISKALEHINTRLEKRARYSVLEDGRLVIKHWVGEGPKDYHANMQIVRKSIIWKVLEEGKALNFTDPSQTNGYEHTLKEKVKIKAAVPLKYIHARTQQEVKFGVLVVDSGKKQTPITEEEFQYLLIMGDLIGETVGKAELVRELIESYENRQYLAKSMAHELRNKFMVIGGFARRLHEKLQSGQEKDYAQIIFSEIGEMEESLQALEEMWKKEGPTNNK